MPATGTLISRFFSNHGNYSNHDNPPDCRVVEKGIFEGSAYLAKRCIQGNESFYQCPWENEMYSRVNQTELSRRCNLDPMFYQGCLEGRKEDVPGNDSLCNSVICEAHDKRIYVNIPPHELCTMNCTNINTDAICDMIDNVLDCLDSNGTTVPLASKCDGHCQCWNCYDERNCTDSDRKFPDFGVLCDNGALFVDPRYICDNVSQCSGGEDEVDCNKPGLLKCGGVVLPQSRCCSPFLLCNDTALDQLNCTDSVMSDRPLLSGSVL
eukprot:sb/3468281/